MQAFLTLNTCALEIWMHLLMIYRHDGIFPEYGHAFQIPREANQRPFARDFLQATQRELTKAQHGLDDAEHRFDSLLAQGIPATQFVDRALCALKLKCNDERRVVAECVSWQDRPKAAAQLSAQ